MKAIVFTKYGSPDVLQLIEVEKPVPGDDDVLTKVRAASINAADYHSLSADIFLVRLVGGELLNPATPAWGSMSPERWRQSVKTLNSSSRVTRYSAGDAAPWPSMPAPEKHHWC